jgi:NADH-quinone oxidoreductase subunit I
MSALKTMCRNVADLWSLIVGLQVTGRNFCRRQVTVHYPRQEIEPEINESFRGPIQLVASPKDPGKPKCISCLICVWSCPSGCITVTKSKPPPVTPEQEKAFQEAEARGEEVQRPAAPREPAGWRYDFSLCSLCGICIEACPVGSIEFSHKLYIAGTSREDFKYDLLAPFIKAGGAKEP